MNLSRITRCPCWAFLLMTAIAIVFFIVSEWTKIKQMTSALSSDPIKHQNSSDLHPHPPDAWKDPSMCNINCLVNVTCEYNDEVDLRIIVMTFNREKSLQACLDHVFNLDTMGDRVSVDIWIDRAKSGTISQKIIDVATKFAKQWLDSGKGRACIHTRESNAGITGQWTDTWYPKPNTEEIGLILEDDVDIAPMSYRWLKAVHKKYDHRTDITGYTLSTQSNTFFGGKMTPMKGPKEDTVLLYGVLGTWGFSPHPVVWRTYQRWSHKVRSQGGVKPYVPGIVPTTWYKTFEKRGTQEDMWEQWHTYYSYVFKMYTVYSNLKEHTGRSDLLLCFNRKEAGLHYSGKGQSGADKQLMSQWNESYVRFPKAIAKYTYNGKILERV